MITKLNFQFVYNSITYDFDVKMVGGLLKFGMYIYIVNITSSYQ